MKRLLFTSTVLLGMSVSVYAQEQKAPAPKSAGQIATEMQLSAMAQQDQDHLTSLVQANQALMSIQQALADTLGIKAEKDKPLPVIEAEIGQLKAKIGDLTNQVAKLTPKPDATPAEPKKE